MRFDEEWGWRDYVYVIFAALLIAVLIVGLLVVISKASEIWYSV